MTCELCFTSYFLGMAVPRVDECGDLSGCGVRWCVVRGTPSGSLVVVRTPIKAKLVNIQIIYSELSCDLRAVHWASCVSSWAVNVEIEPKSTVAAPLPPGGLSVGTVPRSGV